MVAVSTEGEHIVLSQWAMSISPSDQKPTMPELTGLQGRTERINIVRAIGVQWDMVGTTLLDDRDGTIIPAIARKHNNDATYINMEILRTWVQGQGMSDTTWRGLIRVLKEHCTALAESVEEVLTEQDDPQPTDQPAHSPLPLPPCPPLEPQSAVYHFSAYLKSIYGRCVDPDVKWPLLPSEKYINLAVINREEVKSKEQRAFMLATLHGGVDEILDIKHPVTIEKLLDMPIGKTLECVLVEGAPGVGKSTLSWEICKCWKKGILFQQYSLLLLLRLRDQTLHRARTAKDLILYPVKRRLEEISQYLEDTRGKHTLIILEGLDELQRHLLTQPSVFTRLLDGTEFPDATILVTSRPSATAQLWENWKSRISKHVEILGFTDQNITDYVASILDPKDIHSFDTYLCRAPSIRQLMYIPLHSGIIVELFRMYTDSDRLLPTTKTALYAGIVNTILTRYLANHHKYKQHKIKIDKLADLPSDVYTVFMELTELAYQSILQQQLIFEDKDKPINHLGFMDEVAELFPLECKTRLSYNFLHLSLQEYLAAIHVSLMDTHTQERLLEFTCKQHLKNMCVFIAAITHFKDLDREIVKHAIQSECKIEEEGYATCTCTLALSATALEIVFETGDVSLLEGHSSYAYNLSDYTPLFDFTALGQCIAQSSYNWNLQLGNYQQHMQLTIGVEQLVRTIQSNGSPTFTIGTIECYHQETQCKQQLLTGLPLHTLQTLVLSSSTLQPLPQCLPELVHNTNRLRHLLLWGATADSLATTLQALHTSPTPTLQGLSLVGSKFTHPLMQAFCRALLRHNKSIDVVELLDCGITDEQAFCLADTAEPQ